MARKANVVSSYDKMRTEFGGFFDDVSEMLFRYDPMRINFEDNTDEYDPEASTILPRLKDCKSALDARKVVHEELSRWFAPIDMGPEDVYTDIANDIWEAWQKHFVNPH